MRVKVPGDSLIAALNAQKGQYMAFPDYQIMKFKSFKLVIAVLLLLPAVTVALSVQTPQRSGPPQVSPTPTHADVLRGEYGRYRANNDLLFYHLDIRVDPEKRFVSGKNTIRFKMFKDE